MADDLSRWQAALDGRPDVTIRVYPADNHLFFPGEGPSSPAEYEPAQHVDPAVVAGIAYGPAVMLVNPAVPAQSVPAFIAYAKANPGKINMGSAGSGTPQQTIGEMFKMMTGVDMQHVPYRGNLYPDLLSGQVQVCFLTIISSLAHIRAGQLSALGVTTAKRVRFLLDVPAIGETVPGYEVAVWFGICGPKGIPPEIVDKLNAAVNAVLANPALVARFHDLGGEPMPMTSTAFGKLVADEVAKWAKVVKFAGLKVE